MAFSKYFEIGQCIFLTLLLRERIFSKSWKSLRPTLLKSLLVLLSEIDADLNKTKIKKALSIHV